MSAPRLKLQIERRDFVVDFDGPEWLGRQIQAFVNSVAPIEVGSAGANPSTSMSAAELARHRADGAVRSRRYRARLKALRIADEKCPTERKA